MTNKKISDLPAASSVLDSDKIEIESGIAGKSATFLTVWNWIKSKLANFDTVLTNLSDINGKLGYKGGLVNGVTGTDKELVFNELGALATTTGISFDKVAGILSLLKATKYRVNQIVTPAPLFTGTALAGSTGLTINTSFNSTTLAGKALVFTSGANKGQCSVIVSSTATSVTVSNGFINAVTAGDTIEAINVTSVTYDTLGSVNIFSVSNNHAVVLPLISSVNLSGLWNLYCVANADQNKALYIIPSGTNTIDGYYSVNLSQSRECVVQESSYDSGIFAGKWVTTVTSGLNAAATITSVGNFDILTNTATFRPVEGGSGGADHTPVQLLRFIQPAGQEYKLQYTSTIPRRLLFGSNLNLAGITNQTQKAIIRVMKYVESTNTTAEITSSRREITLSSTGDTQQIIITANTTFEIGDQIWIEAASDTDTRQFRVLRSTLDVR